jgi:hypothetical protein
MSDDPSIATDDQGRLVRLTFRITYDGLRSGAFAIGNDLVFRYQGKNHLMRVDALEFKPLSMIEVVCVYVTTQGGTNGTESGARQT